MLRGPDQQAMRSGSGRRLLRDRAAGRGDGSSACCMAAGPPAGRSPVRWGGKIHVSRRGWHACRARAQARAGVALQPVAHRAAKEPSMIRLHYWPTPNGYKVTMLLEEAGLPYEVVPVDIGAGEQFRPEFLAISPNNRIPAIVDTDPVDGGAPLSVFESGAILLYLAEKCLSQAHNDDSATGFLPRAARGRAECLQWLFWQVGGLGDRKRV